MKISDSTIARILEYAWENRRVQSAIAALLAVVALLLGPTYPGGVGVALILLLAGLAAMLGWVAAATEAVGFRGTVKHTFLRKPVHAMFAGYAFVLVVGQHPSFLGFAGVAGLTGLCVYLGHHAGCNRGALDAGDGRIEQAVGLLETEGYVVTRPE